MDLVLGAIDAALRELTLFAAAGFLLGGIDDLLVDLVFVWGLCWRRIRGRPLSTTVDALGHAGRPARLAIFVPAWDEAGVIGAMLSATLRRLRYPDYRVYVGCYPNDRATIDAVLDISVRDPRVRMVIGAEPGPTTKADCLNTLWRALLRDDAAVGHPSRAIILHDAEDVVHPDELRVHDALLRDHQAVQLPVVPLIARGSPFVSGHYADEFAEAHGKQLVVREALGAGLPLAGVGCAIRMDAMVAAAAARGGRPFDADSLTEDYELGLSIAARGGRTTIAHVRGSDGAPVVTRAYFPATIDAAVRQKARWMTGIALAGWDRIGWARTLDPREHWMRMRDRRAPLALLVLAAAYLALVGWGVASALHFATLTAPPALSSATRWLLVANAAMLGWRLVVRAGFTGHGYGWRQAALSVPRAVVGNYIALLAARRALFRYVTWMRGAALRWDKTAHVFPDEFRVDLAA